MKIIVTGAAGFIGSRLVENLLSKGYKVVGIDNLSTGSLDNLINCATDPRFHFISDDLNHFDHWEDIATEGDIIVHLAATVGVKKVFSNSHTTFENNVNSTNRVLEAARKIKCKIFFASSSEVYGQSNRTKLVEENSLIVNVVDQGRSSYVISKLAGELSCLNYHQLNSVPVIIGRFFNVIGTNQKADFGMVIPTFIDAALNGKPMTVYSDGLQRRSFCDLDDVVQAIIGLIFSSDAWGNIFNIGSDESVTIKEVAEYIHLISASDSEIIYLPMPIERSGKSEIRSRLPSIRKINNCIGWRPNKSWQDTISQIVSLKIRQAEALSAL